MDHDERCAGHGESIKELRSLAEINRGALHHHDVVVERIETELRALAMRIPLTLGADLVTLTMNIKAVTVELEGLKALVRAEFVHRNEFDPVRKIVYGLVSLILTAVFVALIALVVVKR